METIIQCERCPASYVGETERISRQRLAEHRRPSYSGICMHSPHTTMWTGTVSKFWINLTIGLREE